MCKYYKIIETVHGSADKVKLKVAQSCPTLRPHGLHSSWNSPGQNTGVGSFSLLQGIFPTQEWNRVFCITGRYQSLGSQPTCLGLLAEFSSLQLCSWGPHFLASCQPRPLSATRDCCHFLQFDSSEPRDNLGSTSHLSYSGL